MNDILVWQESLRRWGATRLANSPKWLVALYVGWQVLRWVFIVLAILSVMLIYALMKLLSSNKS